jgi:hypothetical protein
VQVGADSTSAPTFAFLNIEVFASHLDKGVNHMARSSALRLTKDIIVCKLLAKYGPLPRVSLLAACHYFQQSRVEFKPSSNNCYFNPQGWKDRNTSFVQRGLIFGVWRGRKLVYILTKKGEKLAKTRPEVVLELPSDPFDWRHNHTIPEDFYAA